MPAPFNWSRNVTPGTAQDPDLHARFCAIEDAISLILNRQQEAAVVIPDTALVDASAGAGSGGGGGSDVEPGTVDGQLLRWNDADQVWEPAGNATLSAVGDLQLNATLSVFSQVNALAALVREASGQTQPVIVFQTSSGFSVIRFSPSQALITLTPAVSGGSIYRSDGYAGVPAFVGRRASGTQAAPTAVASGNRLLALQGVGYTGSGYESSPPAAVELVATETHSPTAWGARARVLTTPNGTTAPAEALGVEANGDVTTPGKMRTTGGLGVGNSTAASALGALSDVCEVFDAAGASLGYVPIYATFTP